MTLGCVPTCAKYCLFFFNVVFFLGGGVVLGTGLWMVFDTEAIHTLVRVAGAIRGDDGSYTSNLPNELTPNVILQTGYILIAAGSAAIVFSFLGCCGAIRESQCCLSMYAICLMVILGLEVSAGIYAAVAKKNFEETATAVMDRVLREQYMNGTGNNAITFGWNRMMAELECCGVRDFQDFHNVINWDRHRGLMPVQCCKLKDKRLFIPEDDLCTKQPNERNSNYMKGCYDAMKDVLNTHLTVLMAVGIGIGLSQILGIIFTFILCCAVDQYK